MKIFDISRSLQADLAPWPGDTPFEYRLVARLTEGSSVNLGQILTSLHSGTHADSFFHFDDAGPTMERFAPERYLGPAVVVDLSARFAPNSLGEITQADLEEYAGELRAAPRLLIKTNVWPDSTEFPTAVPTINPAVAEWLGGLGVQLLGLDLPSVDALDSKELPNHHALAAANVAILEGLDLREVPPGVYALAALPLKIPGADGAPVRAVLWQEK